MLVKQVCNSPMKYMDKWVANIKKIFMAPGLATTWVTCPTPLEKCVIQFVPPDK